MSQFKYGLWLDDERKPSKNFCKIVDTYYVAKTYQDAIFYLANFNEDMRYEDLYISFDHDLGQEKTGYDFAKFIVEKGIEIGAFSIHSMNPVGRHNIEHLLTHYGYKYKEK